MGGNIGGGLSQFAGGMVGIATSPYQAVGDVISGHGDQAGQTLMAPLQQESNGMQTAFGGGPKSGGLSMGAPGSIMMPTSAEQVQQQYGNVQNAQAQQQQFLAALQAQNGLANQNTAFQNAQNMANGTGPNPAQAQLAQATGANVANQAAMAAGQRGAGANAGLMARQAANQGAGIQQNAAGQAATLQAQQQLAGQQQMAGIANQQAAQYGQGVQSNNNLSLGSQSNVLGAVGNYNNATAGITNANTSASAAKYAADQQANAGMFGGLMNGLGAAAMFMAKGGQVPNIGGHAPEIGNHGPRSQSAQFLSQAKQLKSGGSVPGHAAAPGNSYKNDTVKAMLSPGEVVIPRSVMQSKDPAEAAKAFVAAVLKHQGAKK